MAASAPPAIPIDSTYDATARVASRGLVASVIGRWPLLLIGIVGGLILAFFGYTQQPRTYESIAKVLVIKKRDSQVGAGDSRVQYVEDYISTQLAILKSDAILLPCAMDLNPDTFDPPLPADDRSRAQYLQLNLTVVRDRESGAGTVIGGSSVLNLSFRGLNPRDTRIILDKIISAYQREVQDVYNTETKSFIKNLEQEIKSRHDSKERSETEMRNLSDQSVRITPQDPRDIAARISRFENELINTRNELTQVKQELELISKVGKNRRDRDALFVAMGGLKQRNLTQDPNSPENTVRMLKAKKTELLERLGTGHPEVKTIDSQIKYWDLVLQTQNPDDPMGELDELGIFEKRLIQRQRTLELIVQSNSDVVSSDTKTLVALRPIMTRMDNLKSKIDADEKDISTKESARDLLNQKSQQEGGYNVKELSKPQEGYQVAPKLLLWLFGGAILGVLIGGGLAFMAELSDKSFRSPAEIRERLGVTIYGHIPDLRKNLPPDVSPVPDVDPSLVSALRPKSIEAESYRGVRAQLMVATQNRSHQVIQVTSPNPGDGKSTLAANLAVSLAQTGKKVILLDCDFRKPRVHKIFNLNKPEVGLASVTNGECELNDAIRYNVVDNLDLLPCGPRPANPAELLTGLNFQDVLTKLKAHYDYVIIDTPPLLAVSDPRVVAQRVDGVLLVFKITKRARPTAERAREQLADMGANLLGVIVNGAGSGTGEYGYGYNYKYTYAYDYEYAEEYVDDDGADAIDAVQK